MPLASPMKPGAVVLETGSMRCHVPDLASGSEDRDITSGPSCAKIIHSLRCGCQAVAKSPVPVKRLSGSQVAFCRSLVMMGIDRVHDLPRS